MANSKNTILENINNLVALYEILTEHGYNETELAPITEAIDTLYSIKESMECQPVTIDAIRNALYTTFNGFIYDKVDETLSNSDIDYSKYFKEAPGYMTVSRIFDVTPHEDITVFGNIVFGKFSLVAEIEAHRLTDYGRISTLYHECEYVYCFDAASLKTFTMVNAKFNIMNAEKTFDFINKIIDDTYDRNCILTPF